MNWIVIMAGGGGTRLWPLSRRKRPKQFLPLLPGGETLLGSTLARVEGLVPVERTLIVTAASQVDEVLRTAPQIPRGNIVVEPEGRNTAACIGLSTVEVERRDPDAVIGVLPSDQFVSDQAAFFAAASRAFSVAGEGLITTIGIHPTSPETGYGYIQAGAARGPAGQHGGAVRVVQRFVEKPDRATAEGYLASGDFVWNAGMFFFSARSMREAIADLLPSLASILEEIRRDPSRTDAVYRTAPKISIDHGVMEKLPGRPHGLFVVEGDFGWNDVGSFSALPELHGSDEAHNTVIGDAILEDARGNIIVGGKKLVAAVGIEGLIVVVTDDAVLVMPRDRAQDVRRVVEALETKARDPYL